MSAGIFAGDHYLLQLTATSRGEIALEFYKTNSNSSEIDFAGSCDLQQTGGSRLRFQLSSSPNCDLSFLDLGDSTFGLEVSYAGYEEHEGGFDIYPEINLNVLRREEWIFLSNFQSLQSWYCRIADGKKLDTCTKADVDVFEFKRK